MVERIGDAAGKVWNYLNKKAGATQGEIQKSLKLPDGLVSMALGWLARENKLCFEGEGKAAKVSLLG